MALDTFLISKGYGELTKLSVDGKRKLRGKAVKKVDAEEPVPAAVEESALATVGEPVPSSDEKYEGKPAEKPVEQDKEPTDLSYGVHLK